jgi:hypothetical protein
MADLFVVVTVLAFFGLCVGFVWGCDKIIGPDDFRSSTESGAEAADDGVQLVAADLGSTAGVTP